MITLTHYARFTVMLWILFMGIAPIHVSAETKTSSPPVKVFILAGQSNMEGQDVVSLDHAKHYNGGKGNLVWSMKNSASAGQMKQFPKAAKDPNSRLRQARKRWKC